MAHFTTMLGKVALTITVRTFATLGLIVILLALVGCEGSRRANGASPDPVWRDLVAAQTTGPISRKGVIRVVFARDVIALADVGKPAPLTSEPAIEGNAVFESTREIALHARGELQPGRSYRLALSSRGLTGVPAKLDDYVFLVQVQAPAFDVRFDGLSAYVGREDAMFLRGEITTADIENPQQVEKILKATLGAKSPPIEWRHGASPLSHAFTIGGLERAEREQRLALAWNGAAIGATNKGEREFIVPGKRQFAVTQIIAANDTGVASERHIAIYFSDVLDAKQDLRGLVRVSGRNAARLRLDGNVLRIYLADKIEGELQVIVDAGVRNRRGATLDEAVSEKVSFAIEKPQVRWVGNGVILPESATGEPLAVPFEAVNLTSVRVTAFRIYENNLPQFLQVNALNGQRELDRVGRYLWRKTIRLAPTRSSGDAGRWTRYSLDLSELMQKNPDGMVRVQLSFGKRDIANECGAKGNRDLDPPPKDADTTEQSEASAWDWVEYYYDDDGDVNWNERDDPCKAAYYRYAPNVRAGRNFIVSNFGLIAKRDQRGELLVAVTDLRTAAPLQNVKVTAFNYQNRPLASAATAADGLARLTTKAAPFLLIADSGDRKGYLKLAPGVALPVSHFDVGGEHVAAGIKATIYGERGVWRPGDKIYLTFALQDASHTLPPNHPVTMELFNPRQQLVQSIVNDKPVGGFYAFTLQTAADAPTGDWTAKATLGGNTFTKTLKIETIMPNRLKIDLQVKELDTRQPLRAQLNAQWLTGATAANLHADVKLRLSKAATAFDRFADFVFDDPAREFSAAPQTVFDGELNEQGGAVIEQPLALQTEAPGMLHAHFTTRVFERGGAFSINHQEQTFSPYERYVGLKLPKGDLARNMLLTDTPHTVEIATLTRDGQPTNVAAIAITVYKINWRWWWDQSGETLAQYTAANEAAIVQQGLAKTENGAGTWSFTVKYPDWGRYLIRACDTEGGHCTGRTFYVDWPYWAGRPQDQSGPGANALSIVADKADYRVGETAHIDLPEGATGRALFTVENGTRILDARWLDVKDGARRIDVALTSAMSPNVYASVMLLQAHAKSNDRPIRMYGIVPLKVSDSKTLLHPLIATDREWQPEAKVAVQVSERDGRAMEYTLALVDEGLLGLTNFKTPALHDYFYKREALGVTTWDVFDEVVGAYGANLERLLALGGSDRQETNQEKDRSRFPPLVQFIGPFSLTAGERKQHELTLPQYVGAVRVMLIAGHDGAYGSAEQTVPVRQALMILPTLPRVVGPDEEIAVPISVFVADAAIRNVDVAIETDGHFDIVGARTTHLTFSQPAEQVALLRVKTKPRVGKGRVAFSAVSGAHRAHAEIYIDVRSGNPPTVRVQQKTLQPGETWRTQVAPHGLLGTNTVALEIAAVPPLNLENRLSYLIHYPYGCVEQTTSSVFPQLYLSSLLNLTEARKREIETNVKAGIERLQNFQQANGGFAYWPGGWVYGPDDRNVVDPRLAWATNYVGHFLLEAERFGYRVPEPMLKSWARYQRNAAQQWQPSTFSYQTSNVLDQAYRLYTLALANQAEIGAMNRLREVNSLTTPARWLLAASYKLAGLDDAAELVIREDRLNFNEYAHPDWTFGSRLRDMAIVLDAWLTLGKQDTKSLVDAISAELVAERWYSTQSLAYSLLAMSRFVGGAQVGAYRVERAYANVHGAVESKSPLYREELTAFPEAGGELVVKNTSDRTLFASVIVRGVARSGDDTATASGLSLDVTYVDPDGKPIDVTHLRSGTDLVARVTVKNTERYAIENIALTHMIPSGWEIHNDRMDGVVPAGERSQTRVEPWYSSIARNARKAEYVDIRDDRILSFFALNPGESIDFIARLNAAYVGRYYLPSVSVEAMYDASKHASTQGRWIEVVRR